jgi:peptidylprolyl isomerase
MKTIYPLSILALSFAVLSGTAQNVVTAKPAATPAKTAAGNSTAPVAKKAVAAPGCSKDLPTLSAKIPALPAGSACAKPLYTITLQSPATLSRVSPMEGADLAESLGTKSSSFTLSYIDTKVGSGPLAQPNKWYSLHYTGYLPDGTVFDASSKHPEADPFVFQQGLNGPMSRRSVITGWDTGISGMRVGGKRRLFIPYQLAYGPNGQPQGGIPGKTWLIFDLELVAQNDTNPSPAPPTPPAASGPNGRPGIPMKPVPNGSMGVGYGSGASAPTVTVQPQTTAPAATAPAAAPTAPAPPVPAPAPKP